MRLLFKPSLGATLATSACALLLFSAPSIKADTFYNLSFTGTVTGTGTMDLNPTTDQITVTLTNTTNLNGSSPSSDDNLIAGRCRAGQGHPSTSNGRVGSTADNRGRRGGYPGSG